jgi:hypothetical protein
MKTTYFILILTFISINCIAQNLKFPAGVYLNLEQLKNKTPAFDANLHIIQRTQGDIGFNGGNDYEIASNIDSIDKKFIKKTIFAYVKNDSVFLNCIHHKLSTWYALGLTQGTFIAFKGAMSNEKAGEQVGSYGALFGAIGGGIAGSNAAKKRFLYVFSLRTGNVKLLKKEYVIERLKENQNLLDQFNAEKDQNSDSTLIKYIGLINEVIPINSPAPPQQEVK